MGPASCGRALAGVSGGFPAERAWGSVASTSTRRRVASALPGVPRLCGQGPIAVLDSPKGDYRTERPLGALRVSPSGGSRPRGHDKSELGAAAGRTAHADRAAMRLDKTLDDVQAQTGAAAVPASAAAAAGLAAPELAEHPGGHVGRDALALVPDGHGDRVGIPVPALQA